MADKPIIFSGPMVRALLEGRKTQTRRVLTPHCDAAPAFLHQGVITALDEMERSYRWPHTKAVADRLYVREAFMPAPMESAPTVPRQTRWNIAYGAGGQSEVMAPANYDPMLYNYERWSPSIHMPRWASRLTLTVTDVRVQRLQDISEADAVAEGSQEPSLRQLGGDLEQAAWSERQVFQRLWNSLHGPDAWDANPWVAAYSFNVQRGNIDNG